MTIKSAISLCICTLHTYALHKPFDVLKSMHEMIDIVSLSAKIITRMIQPYLARKTVRKMYEWVYRDSISMQCSGLNMRSVEAYFVRTSMTA